MIRRPRTLTFIALAVVTALSSALALALGSKQDGAYTLSAFIALTCSVSFLMRYSDNFPISAYISIGLTVFFASASILFLCVDLAFTVSYRNSGNLEDYKSIHDSMRIFWNVIYWCNFIFGTIMNTFLQRYWRTGHFSIIWRTLTALRNLIIIIAILGGLGLVGGLILYFWQKETGLSAAKACLLILSNMYGLIILVLLLGYGLFNLPM